MTGLRSRFERPVRAVVAAVVAGTILGALLSLAAGPTLRRELFDAWQRWAPREITADRVAVVLVDPLSIATVGPWPWPRSYLAQLVETITRQNPKVIGLDIYFAEPDTLNPSNFASLYPELPETAVAALRQLPTMDQDFAEVIGRAPVVLARFGIATGGTDPGELMADPEVAGRPPPSTLAFRQVLASIPELDDVAMGYGMVNGPPDPDGVVRRVPLTVLAGNRPLPGFAVELARIGSGAEKLEWRGRHLALGNKLIPADEAGNLVLRFGPFPESAIHSAARVLAGEAGKVPADAFTGKVVLIGLAAEGTADIVATPLETEGYGVFVQAQAADAILGRAWLARPPWAAPAEWAAGGLLAALALLAGLLAKRWPLLLALGLGLALPLAAGLAFASANLLLDPLRPLLLALGAAGGLGLVLFRRARAERARLAAELVDQQVAGALQEGELQAARRIQLGMVPSARTLASLDPRVEVAAVLKPARQVGGDFYEAVRLDDDRLLFVVGDVTGKGVPAALYMALSKTLTKSVLIRHRGELAETVASINAELLREADEEMGVTMLIVLLDCATGELAMVNAGHENPIVAGRGQVSSLALAGGPPFCVCEFPYPAEQAELSAGETLVLISDGVTEAQDRDGGLFGTARTLEALADLNGSAATERVDRLRRAVVDFEGGKEASDDLTIVAIRYLGAEKAAA